MDHQPVEISSAKLAELKPDTGTKLFLGGIWGQVESGQKWLATDGERLVISADSITVIYLLLSKNTTLNDKIFIQSSTGFGGEVTTYPLAEAGRRAAPMARLVEYEMQIMIGIFAATSGGGLAAVIGTDILQFLVNNKDQMGKWGKALGACAACRAVLKQHAPSLYDKLVEGTLFAAGMSRTSRRRHSMIPKPPDVRSARSLGSSAREPQRPVSAR